MARCHHPPGSAQKGLGGGPDSLEPLGDGKVSLVYQLEPVRFWHESSGPVCRAASTRFTRPTLFGFAQPIRGEVWPWTLPQQWLDTHTDTPASHRLVYAGFSEDAAGVVWVFYNVLPSHS